MIFGDGVGASLVRAPYCQLDVGLCVMMFLICLLGYPNVRTEPQSEIGRNRGKKQLDVGLCEVDVFLHWNSAAEEGAWVGLKPDLQGGTGFNLLRVQFWTPVQKKRVSKRIRKWTRLKSKVVPPGGSIFGPFLTDSLWQIC